jgi:rhamnogalacturonan endolyase
MPLTSSRFARYCTLVVASLGVAVAAHAQKAAGDKVTVTDDGAAYVLSNGIIDARVEKKSGDLISIKYKGTEMTATLPGQPPGREYAYWSHDAKSEDTTARVSIDPATNGGERAEVAVKGISHGKPLGDGPGGTFIADIDIHYALGRGDSAIYTYMMMNHAPDYPSTVLGEARFCVKIADFFDWMSVGPKWDKLYPKAEGAAAHEDKYDFTADQFENRAYGWSSTSKNVGFWFINPTVEYLSGGPTKVEFLGHRDTNSVQAPTILNYWRSSHYGGAVADANQGEQWDKVVGPFLLYFNSANGHEALYKDAVARSNVEAQKWPFGWVNGVDYPHKDERATVSGHIVLKDPQAKSTKLPNLRVGLTAPAYTIQPTARDGGGSAAAAVTPTAGVQPRQIDWQTDAKHYEFWVEGDVNGNFNLTGVRPGTYTLHAFADGVLGEMAKTDITVTAGKSLNLGSIEWTPVRHGRQVWEIGVANRTGIEFDGGDNYAHDGTFLDYAKLFPNDVNYVIGKSDFKKDWYFEQVPHNEDPNAKPAAYNQRTPMGRATPWTITFDMPQAGGSGKAHLRLGLASTSLRQFDVAVNDQPVATVDHLTSDGAIGRNGIHGVWSERDVVFDAAMLKPGKNVIKLTVPAGSLQSGIIYDYLRLELE